jgi:hypothetical protein
MVATCDLLAVIDVNRIAHDQEYGPAESLTNFGLTDSRTHFNNTRCVKRAGEAGGSSGCPAVDLVVSRVQRLQKRPFRQYDRANRRRLFNPPFAVLRCLCDFRQPSLYKRERDNK